MANVKESRIKRVVAANVNGVFMASVIKRTGISKAQAKDLVMAYILCGENTSINQYVNSEA